MPSIPDSCAAADANVAAYPAPHAACATDFRRLPASLYPVGPTAPAYEPEPYSPEPGEPSLQNQALNLMLYDLCEPGNPVVQPLSEQICLLQELFLTALYAGLDAAGIDLSAKITVYLNEQGRLGISGAHPDKPAIEALLAENPRLTRIFRTLSAYSEIARDLGNIRRLCGALSAEAVRPDAEPEPDTDADRPAPEDGCPGDYHLSLKGGMSHFYFI